MKLKITAALIALAATSHGALVTLSSFAQTYNAIDDYGVELSTGAAVASGAGLASVIVFSTLTDTQVADLAAAQDYTTLFAPANFVTVTTDNFTKFAGAGYGAVDGFFDLGVTGYVPTVLNKTIYAYFTSGTELGLVKTNSVFAADAPPPAAETSYSLSLAGSTAVIGSFDTYEVPVYGPGGTTDQIANSLKLVNAIPEPSAALLGALGALGLLRRRRI